MPNSIIQLHEFNNHCTCLNKNCGKSHNNAMRKVNNHLKTCEQTLNNGCQICQMIHINLMQISLCCDHAEDEHQGCETPFYTHIVNQIDENHRWKLKTFRDAAVTFFSTRTPAFQEVQRSEGGIRDRGLNRQMDLMQIIAEKNTKFQRRETMNQYINGQVDNNFGIMRTRFKQDLTISEKTANIPAAFEICLDDIHYNKDDRLGSGFFGEVFKGTWCGEPVAVKTVKPGRMDFAQFIQEASIALEFTHKNIVSTIGVCSAKQYIFTEFMSGGNLKDYVQKNRLTSSDYLPVAQKIACAMAHLELKGIVHRDLAARNILLGETLDSIKLADFGLARCLEDSPYYKTDNGLFPFKWTAPEAFVLSDSNMIDRKKGKYTTASDVWSFGVVLWELYSKGAEPYAGLDGRQVYNKLINDNYRLPCPTACPPSTIYAKMLECWCIQANPTFAQMHAFLLNPYGIAP